MKHLKTFESYDINEWVGQRFITGHGPGEKEEAKQRIASEIDSAIQEYEENPRDFVEYDEDELRTSLLDQAKDNGYRGSVVVRQSPNDSRSQYAGYNFIVYDQKTSPLQDIGSAAASGRAKIMQ